MAPTRSPSRKPQVRRRGLGQRWARRGQVRDHGVASSQHDEVDYIAMYWFTGDPDEAVREWTSLGENTFQTGRVPLIPGVERHLLAFFDPVDGQRHSTLLMGQGEEIPYGGMRMRIVYLDGDLLPTAQKVAETTAALDETCAKDARESEKLMIDGPVSTITPWEGW